MTRRRIRLTGGETVKERAERLAEVATAHLPERHRFWARTGFIGGYLAAVDDTVTEEPARPAEAKE